MAFASFDRRQGDTAPMAEINMVPLIDVMLVLVVIFIVTAPLMTHAVRLQLPRADASVERLQPDRIEFTIDAAGERRWNGDPVTREEAAQRFAELGSRAPDAEIRLRADQSVPYRLVAETLADASRAGLARIGFVSDPEPK
jgi:biopolymer transport protein ExbD